MGKKNAADKRYYSAEELQKIKKSDYYREALAQYIGCQIIMDVPFYEFKEFNVDKHRACLREAEVIRINNKTLSKDSILEIEHIWVAINKSVKIDAGKPIRVMGVPYEYAHKCGNQIVKNIGLKIMYVTQTCFSGW